MSNVNKVLLHGNLTSDPNVKESPKNGRAVVSFSLATNRDWKNKDGQRVTETDFHRVVAFGPLGNIVGTHLKKGAPVLVQGRLTNRSYTGDDGKKKYITEVVMDDFNFLPRGSGKAKEAKEKELVAA